MKCWHCEAQNLRHSSSCWACGVQLQRSSRKRAGIRPEAMRHYSTASVAIEGHRAWLDGLVLLSTILFGVLMGYFLVDVMPGSMAGMSTDRFNLANGPLSFFQPQARALPLQQVGAAQSANGVVAQVADVRRARAEAGKEAPAGMQFVTATVVIDNQGKQALNYALSDWRVRDSRGRNIPAQVVNSAGWLSSGRVMPGQSVQGAVTFAVPEGEANAQITFSPSGLGALMRWDAAGR